MTFATHKDTPGRQAANVLELDLDYCSRSYGIAPCTADLGLQNFLIRSEELNTSWGTVNASVAVDQIANPINGAVNVDEVIEDSTPSQQHRINQTTVKSDFLKSDVVTFAAYAFQGVGSRNAHLLFWNGADVIRATFNLASGTLVHSTDAGNSLFLNATINAVPGKPGWFRVTTTGQIDPNSSSTIAISGGLQLADGIQSFYNGDGVSSMYYFGAQLRLGAVAGKYTKTTTAAVDGMGIADNLCFNTFGTCQDTANFLKEMRTLRFIDTLQRPYQFLDAYPNIISVRYAPTVLKPGGNLSIRGQVSVTLQDFATTDNEIDDYAIERSYDSEDQGTFFGKLKARHPFYIGRPMRLLEGYLDDASLSDFRTREYIIDDISGPTADGKVVIKGKDILSLASDVRAKCPTASTGTVATLVTVGASSVIVSAGDGVQYDPTTVDKHIRINDEIMRVNSRATDTLNVTRGQGGTEPAEHEVGDGIQACKTYEDEPVIDVVQELLEDFASIPTSFIPFTDWELEETQSLSGFDMETIISEPTGVLTLLKEIAEITLIDLWYDDTAQEVKLKLQTPFTEATETITDELEILKDSLKVKDLNSQRLTRILIYYGIRNYAEKLKDSENFSLVNFEIEADKEGVNKYNDERIKVIHSRWFDSTNAVQVALTSARLLNRFATTPKQIQFNLDAKDVERLTTGEVFDLTSRIEQDIDGSDATHRYQVTETKALKPGSQYLYKADAFFPDPVPDTLTIASNEIDYNVFVELGGPPFAVDVTLTINAGVDVDGSNGNPAITTEGMHPDSTIRVVNNGEVRGYGGNAGDGGRVFGLFAFEPGQGCLGFANGFDGDNGQPGGDAINATIDITIDNTNGNIWAGAGAGGGGGCDQIFNTFGGGGGGGGGRGTDTGNLGSGGDADVQGFGPGCSTTNDDGTPGTAGDTSTPGSAGVGGDSAGDGGAGGADWGDDGNDGQDGNGASKGSGGQGGFAVRLNGSAIVWEGGNTAAKVKGDVA